MVFAQYVIYFVIYSFCGWLHELWYDAVFHHKLHLRGFLSLPILPIYGLSSVAIIILVRPYATNPFLVFMAAALVVTAFEYITSVLLEKVFHISLWNYDDMPLNIKGRVSLFTSLGFGVLGLLLCYVLQPFFSSFIGQMNPQTVFVIGIILFAVVALDITHSVSSLVCLRIDMKQVRGTLDDIQDYINDRIGDFKNNRKLIRLFIQRIYRQNLNHIRKAFPEANIITKKK